MKIAGRVHLLGDDINTDYIIASKYKSSILDMNELVQYVLEDYDPDIAQRIKPGDVLAAGKNFGCGSARETAPLVLKHAGVAAVIAKSFARIFYRNAFNVGLPIVESDTSTIQDGDIIELDWAAGRLFNKTRRIETRYSAPPPELLSILQAGGLLEYYQQHQRFPWS